MFHTQSVFLIYRSISYFAAITIFVPTVYSSTGVLLKCTNLLRQLAVAVEYRINRECSLGL